MATVVIQGGTRRINGVLYEYVYNTNEGEVAVPFTASQKPKIGDSITDGVLVPLVGYIINQDHSLWVKQEDEVWGCVAED